nr:hypothetical protein [uncultured Microbacterium sp.]
MTAVFSRRGMLGAGAVALGVGVAAGGSTAYAAAQSTPASAGAHAVTDAVTADAAASAPGSDPLRPTRSVFTGREGTAYVGSSPWSEHHLVLDAVRDLPGDGDAEHRFSVEFTADVRARDGIYRLVSDGELVASLFLARAGGVSTLEGVVDRREAP